jgi:ribosomal protein S3
MSVKTPIKLKSKEFKAKISGRLHCQERRKWFQEAAAML